MEIGRLYRVLDRSWTHHLLSPIVLRFWLPTEMVVLEPKIVTPREARAYRTFLYCDNGDALPYVELSARKARRRERTRGTAYEREIAMAEVWSDYGDDGHVEYTHIGWRFVPSDVLRLRSKYRLGVDGLPEAMKEQIWDRCDTITEKE